MTTDVQACEGCGCPLEMPTFVVEPQPGVQVAYCLSCQERIAEGVKQLAAALPAVFNCLAEVLTRAAEAFQGLARQLEKRPKDGS